MSSVPKYAARIARLPLVFERLAARPEGIPLSELAKALNLPEPELLDDLLAFYTADVSTEWLLGLTRPAVLEFLGPDGDEVEPSTAQIVRMVDEAGELGVEYVDAAELALVHTAAHTLLDVEPDNEHLRAALAVLEETMLGATDAPSDARAARWNQALPLLQQAREQQRAVRIVYSRSWDHGVFAREIEPYRLVQTRRGWEVDAGPLQADGDLRTYLLSNIRNVVLLDRTFEMTDELRPVLDTLRETTTVRVGLPQSARWAADFYAEKVTHVDDDEEMAILELELLPPLTQRVGMLLLAADNNAIVVSPSELDQAGVVLAEELLTHHTTGVNE